MRKISTSTWLLVGLAALALVLGAALLFGTPPERWSELRSFRGAYGYAAPSISGAPDGAGGRDIPYYAWRRFGGPHGHPPFFALVFIILLAAFAARRFFSSGRRSDSSLSILEERFAEGKIDEAEFTRKRSVLNGTIGTED